MTSWAIWTEPSPEGDGEVTIGTEALGIGEPGGEAVGGAEGGAVGVGVGRGVAVVTGDEGDADGEGETLVSDGDGLGDEPGSGWSFSTETFVWGLPLREKTTISWPSREPTTVWAVPSTWTWWFSEAAVVSHGFASVEQTSSTIAVDTW